MSDRLRRRREYFLRRSPAFLPYGFPAAVFLRRAVLPYRRLRIRCPEYCPASVPYRPMSRKAEDEKSLSKAIAAILEKNHFSVDTVYNGDDALSCLESGNYDGAILDIMMPGTDGITVLKKVRESGNKIPILLLTAKSDVEDKVLGLDSGANDYLTKPFAARELLARIRAMLRSQSAHTDSRLRVGNVVLDTAAFELTSPAGSFRLANKEFQMIELLMRNPGQLISPEHFMERIWGYDSDTEISVIWVYISYLRKKLTALRADIQIRAVRNAGYVLEEIS